MYIDESDLKELSNGEIRDIITTCLNILINRLNK